MHRLHDRSPGVAAVLRQFEARLGHLALPDLEFGCRVAARLTPPNWTLEWRLPTWLGRAFGAKPALIDDLVLANVLGLVAIRLFDDLADGEVQAADRSAARRAADAAYDQALEVYRGWFVPASPLWPFIDATMRRWHRSSLQAAARAPAARGAPLKIPAFALCLATAGHDRPDDDSRWPPLERCLDAALTAFVLYDQFADWDADLRAGRSNAFVDQAVPRRANGGGERTPAEVLAAMMTRPVVREHFALVTKAAAEGASVAESLGIAPLARHLAGYAAAAAALAIDVAAHYEGAADRAVRVLLGREGSRESPSATGDDTMARRVIGAHA